MEIKPGQTALIIGCGYLGRRIADQFLQRGCAVTATTRSQQKAANLKQAGITPLVMDFSKELTVSFPQFDYLVISLAPDSSTVSDYESIYGRSIPHLAALLSKAGNKRILYTSSTGIYGHESKGETDETTPIVIRNPKQQALKNAEIAVLNTEPSGMILRLAGIYGPERNRLNQIEHGDLPRIDDQAMANLIHLEDAARLVLFLFERGTGGEIYLGVDSEPVQRIQMYTWIAQKAGVELTWGSKMETHARENRFLNRKISNMGFLFTYPTFREGYSALL